MPIQVVAISLDDITTQERVVAISLEDITTHVRVVVIPLGYHKRLHLSSSYAYRVAQRKFGS